MLFRSVSQSRYENVWSNVLGETLTSPIAVPGEEGQFFTKSYSRTTISYFAEHSVYLEKFTLSVGAMTNWISDLGFGWNIYPGLDAAYSFSEHYKISGSVNSTLRMPTFTDLFYSGPTNIGNPDLKPEKSVTYEGSIRINYTGFSGHAGMYHRRGKNLIDWVRENETEKWQPQNLTRINSTGLEFNGTFFPEKIWKKSFPITKIGLNYSYTTLDKEKDYFFSNYVLDNLKHKFDAELDHKIWGKLNGLS